MMHAQSAAPVPGPSPRATLDARRGASDERQMMVNERLTTKTVQKYLADLRVQRYAAIVQTIPVAVPSGLCIEYQRYADPATRLLGKRRLARVHWPWSDRVQESRVARGNPSRNPTALP